VLIATKQSEFVEVNEKSGALKLVICGHGGEGQLWGLATHPNGSKFVTSSDDGTVRMWDIKNRVIEEYFELKCFLDLKIIIFKINFSYITKVSMDKKWYLLS